MNMKTILLAAGVGYLLFHEQITAMLKGAATTAGSAGTGSQGNTSAGGSTDTATPPAPPAGIWDALKAWGATQGPTLSADVWDWGYKQLRGNDGPAPETIGLNHTRLYTFEEYKAAMVTAGLSGARAGSGGVTALPANAPDRARLALQRRPAGSYARRAWGY